MNVAKYTYISRQPVLLQCVLSCVICDSVQNGSVIWSSDVEGDIESELSSIMSSCSQQDSPSYVELHVRCCSSVAN